MTICDKKADMLPAASGILEKDENTCPVAWALECANIARLETCGKCVMCRDGMNQVYHIISDITEENGQPDDINMLKELCGVIKTMGGCEMSKTAAGLILTSIEKYTEEWDIHIKRNRCTALVCKRYYTVHILPEQCSGAGACISACKFGAIAGGAGLISVVDNDKCTRCGECFKVCPNGAVIKAGGVKPRVPEEPVPVGSFGGGRRRRRGGAAEE